MAQQVGNGRRTWGAFAPVALLALVATAGCAVQSELTDVWKDPSFASGPMHNVLVVVLRKDPVRRRMWEDEFTRDLGARGLTATSSYQLFPGAPPDTQEVIDAVRQNGYDAVLTSVRLPDETTSTYVPGATRHETVVARDFYGSFHTYWRDVQDPGHTETDQISSFQTEVWATGGGGGLVCSVKLRTLESVTSRTIGLAVTRYIDPELEKQGLVPKRK